MKVKLYEHDHDEEFYAQFIQIRSSVGASVLVFYDGPESRDLAERIASVMGDEFEWVDSDRDRPRARG